MKKKILFWLLGIVIIIFSGVLFFRTETKSQKGLLIMFNKNGNIKEYKTSGFSGPETNFTWTNGDIASIDIPLPESSEDDFFCASFEASPFVYKRLKKQKVGIFVNDRFISDFDVVGKDVYKFRFAHNVKTSGEVANIKFKISNPKSPKDFGLSQDSRKLGIAITKMLLSKCDKNNTGVFATYQIGDEIDFSSKGNSGLYTAKGWSFPERDFTWTDGKDAYINMFVDNAMEKSLQLSVTVKQSAFDEKSSAQDVTVYVNDKEMTTWHIGKSESTYAVKIPEFVVGNGTLKIRFHINNPVKVGNDSRDLGIAVESMKIKNLFADKIKTKIASWIKSKIINDPEPKEQNTK